MSQTDALFQLEYEQEANWGENVSTFATHRPPLIKPIDLGPLTQDAINPNRNVSQLQGGTTWFPGLKDGQLTIDMYLHGHGSSTAGATTIDPVETFWSYFFGNPALAEANAAPTRTAAVGTTAAAASTTTSINTVASGTLARGALFRLGTGGLSADGRGSGQFYQVGSHVGTVLVPRNATITAPNAADVIYSGVNQYLPETPANTAIKSWRGRILTGNQRYIVRGVYPKALRLQGLSPGEIATLSGDVGVTSWDSTSGGAFPSAVARNDYDPQPNAGGSFIVGDVGSAVRVPYDAREFNINIELGVVPLPGHGAVDPFSKYVAARRTPSKITGSFVIDAEASGTNTFETKFLAKTSIWIVASLSTTAGASLGIALQNCKIVKRPKQISRNGINSFLVDFCAYAGTDTTTDLSQAALVLCAA